MDELGFAVCSYFIKLSFVDDTFVKQYCPYPYTEDILTTTTKNNVYYEAFYTHKSTCEISKPHRKK